MGGYSLKVLTPRSGDTTVARMRFKVYLPQALDKFFCFVFSFKITHCLRNCLQQLDALTHKDELFGSW